MTDGMLLREAMSDPMLEAYQVRNSSSGQLLAIQSLIYISATARR